MNIKLEWVIIPPDRFREADEKKVAELVESYAKFGQLQPIIVTRDFVLVAGLHRVNAARRSGWAEINAEYQDSTDELFLREVELEENIRRKQMTWLEEQKALAAIHSIRQLRDPSWGQAQTRELTGAARQADVSEALKITRMVQLFPEIATAKSKTQALSWMKSKAKSMLRVDDVRNNQEDYAPIEERLVLGDSTEVIKTIADESFHAIITDPPFGIDYDDRKAGTTGTLSSYEDSKASYERILSMAPELYRTLRADGWLVWFLGISWYERAKEAFRGAGFTVDEIPIIWDRSEGRTFTTRPDRYFGRSYDIALHCLKGNPEIVAQYRGKSNIIRIAPVSTQERETLVERPVELYAELIKRLTYPGEVVADFFTGSGSCLAAAASLGRNYFGVELDPERRAYAIKKIKAHTPDGD